MVNFLFSLAIGAALKQLVLGVYNYYYDAGQSW